MENQSLFKKNHSDIDPRQFDPDGSGPIFKTKTENMLTTLFGYKRVLGNTPSLMKVIERWEDYVYILHFDPNLIKLRIVNEKEFRRISLDVSKHFVTDPTEVQPLPIERYLHEMLCAVKSLCLFNYEDDYKCLKESITTKELYYVLHDLYDADISDIIKDHKLGGL